MKAFGSWLIRVSRLRAVRYGAVFALAACLFALALTWRPAIAPIAVSSPSMFAAEQVRRGAILAKLGDCAVCHTADDGRPLAGARPLATPFGTLYSDNLTPDPETGIGRRVPASDEERRELGRLVPLSSAPLRAFHPRHGHGSRRALCLPQDRHLARA
jgi:hypothetical protein